MKGFARILESIVASIIILTSLTFFFVHNVPESPWDDTSLQLISQDVLQTSYLSGNLKGLVKSDDKAGLNNYFSQALPKTIDFSLNVMRLPNDIIYVGCAQCSMGDLSELSMILEPLDFYYNGRPTSIRLDIVNVSSIPDDTDILLFFDKSKIGPDRDEIEDFLMDGGTVFLLSNLNQDDLTGYISELFNLSWSGLIGPDVVVFDEVFDPKNLSYYAARYYGDINQTDLTDLSTEQFNDFNSNGVLRKGDGKDIMVGQSNGKTYVRANEYVNGMGRTVWFGDYIRTSHNSTNTKKIDDLIKSMVMWGSGQAYSMDITQKTPAARHFSSDIFVFDGEPYIFEIIVWRVFY